MEEFTLENIQKLTRENSLWCKRVEYIKESILKNAQEGYSKLCVNVVDLEYDDLCKIRDYLHKFNPEYNEYTKELTFSW